VHQAVMEAIQEHQRWDRGPFAFVNLGRDGVRLSFREDDDLHGESVHLHPEQVAELRQWLEAR
jgi:hypothetical protein